MDKLDPRLRHVLRRRFAEARETAVRTPEIAGEVGYGRAAERFDTVEVLVRCGDGLDPDVLQALGMKMHFMAQGPYPVISGEVSLDALMRLQDVPFVRRVEASRPLVPELDLSCAEVRATPLHQAAAPVRGAAVIVGLVDSGIDFTHPNFRNPDGSSRILLLWDQGGQHRPHSSVPYGREYTRADLDQALASANPLALVPHEDIEGHGTHVAGIAAGNGRASNGQFTGIAPDADLIVVVLETERGRTFGRSARVFDACTYIVQRSNGSPVAINLSQGMNGGGHAGETVLETGLDNLARQSGMVLVKSAGNEQEWNVHAGGELAQGQTVALEFEVQNGDRESDVIVVWYSGADQISIAAQPPDSLPLDFVAPGGVQDFGMPEGNSISIDFDLNTDDTGDTMATIILSHGSLPLIQEGAWRLLLRGDQVQHRRYDAWIERTRRDRLGEQTRFSDASYDPTCTLSIPGTARRIITVGSYVMRPEAGLSQPEGAISSFSSHGPPRYGWQKPEIAAPGEMIVSARSAQSCLLAEADRWHTRMRGTSMAAAHVTGAAALLLSLRQDLTCSQVKQLLTQTARRDGAASSAPDNTWGSGKLDIAAAVERARTAQFPRIRNARVHGATLVWETDILTTGAVVFHTHQRQLQLGKSLGSQQDQTLRKAHSVTLRDVGTGTYYCEIQAVSQDGWWTLDDNQGIGYVVEVPPFLDRSAAPGPLHLNITQIMLAETPVEPQRADHVLEQHIRALLHFQLSGMAVEPSSVKQLACFVQILAYEVSTGRTVVLAADQQQIRSGEQDYTTSLTFAMPEVGRYQLMGMVLLPDINAVEVALGPPFRVTP